MQLEEDKQVKVQELVSAVCQQEQLDLVEINFRPQGPTLLIEVLVDLLGGGISLEQCTVLNRKIGTLLEEKNFLPERCVLEVSSPGLDRQLKNAGDFRRMIGKRVRFLLKEPVAAKWEYVGQVVEVAPEQVTITGDNLSRIIPFSVINKATLEIKV